MVCLRVITNSTDNAGWQGTPTFIWFWFPAHVTRRIATPETMTASHNAF